jgi:hypothetical protein
MKKFMFLLMICGGFLGTAQIHAQQTTQEQHQQIKFYYYPSSNVYFNPATNDYWYYNDSTTTWVTAKELPTTIVLEKTPVYTVYHNDADVWKDNAEHIKKYKVSKNGKVKEKPKG